MANPRRNGNQSSENPFFNTQSHFSHSSSSLIQFLKKPRALLFLLTIFIFLTWATLRLQHSSYLSSGTSRINKDTTHQLLKNKDGASNDRLANLVRFAPGFPSRIAKDRRGWLLDPISLALDSGISGGAVSCASLHLGEIRPAALRGNHRHHSCNETFVIWGAAIKFRLENNEVDDKGYSEVTIGADEVAVATSPSGTAHALINIDPVRTAYFIGCQDSVINYNSSSTDFNVWKNFQ